jgi:hypothetical protein
MDGYKELRDPAVICTACGMTRTKDNPYDVDCPECYQFMKRFYAGSHGTIAALREMCDEKDRIINGYRHELSFLPDGVGIREHVEYLERSISAMDDDMSQMKATSEKEQQQRDQMLSQVAVQLAQMGHENAYYRKAIHGLIPILGKMKDSQSEHIGNLMNILRDVLAASHEGGE